MSETQRYPDRLVKASEAATILGTTPKGLVAMIRAGQLAAKKRLVQHKPGCKPKANYLILESELTRYMVDLPDAGTPVQRRASRRESLSDVIQFVS